MAILNMRAFELDDRGWVMRARHVLSPHHDARPRAGSPPSLVVIHAISLPAGQFGGRDIERLFTQGLDETVHASYALLRGLQVSAHFLILRTGALTQFVSTDRRAWHAGVSRWQGRDDCNDFSLGIELEGTDDQPFTEAQYVTLESLLAGLRQRYPIRSLTGHSDIAPGRKTDPGPHFDWMRWRHFGYWVTLREPKMVESG